ncbi:hypothetical protein [Actinomadura rupiterrae]|uniref:hypothetical protein n=1 Tax=Actinomadura rupiterrae TaxID=559627 RepID=UPI0020A3DD67|nr:hypothetical protein [Actinomadura rupiterrae]MCP2342030.1 hypothetical protein [Actinomadura rupiterrae]
MAVPPSADGEELDPLYDCIEELDESFQQAAFEFAELGFEVDDAIAEANFPEVECMLQALAHRSRFVDLRGLVERAQLAALHGARPIPDSSWQAEPIPRVNIKDLPQIDSLADNDDDEYGARIEQARHTLDQWGDHIRELFQYTEDLWRTIRSAASDGDILKVVIGVDRISEVGDAADHAYASWSEAAADVHAIGGRLPGMGGEMLGAFESWLLTQTPTTPKPASQQRSTPAAEAQAETDETHLTSPIARDYERLLRAMLSVAETSEAAWPLHSLDGFLKPWYRDELLSREGNLSWGDCQKDLEGVFTGAAVHGTRYAELRKQLFSDIHQIGDEPPWRKVGMPFSRNFAVCALCQAFQRNPIYVLRSVGPFSDHGWELTIVSEGAEATFQVHTRLDPGEQHVVHVDAPDLRDRNIDQPGAYEQVGHGFRCLGYTPFLKR